MIHKKKKQPATKTLIIGSGYVGSKLAESLADQKVVDVSRDKNKASSKAKVSDKHNRVYVDFSLSASLNQFENNYSTIYFLIPPRLKNNDNPNSYLSSVENSLALAARQKKLQHFIFASSTSLYGQHSGEIIDENDALLPINDSAKLILKAEELIRSYSKKYNFKIFIVRFSGIYGPGRTSRLNNLSQTKLETITGELNNYNNHIHRDDATGILKHLANLNSSYEVFIATDSLPATSKELCIFVNDNLNKNRAKTISAQKSKRYSNKRLSNQRILNTGYKFKYATFKEGYRDLLDELELKGAG